MTRRSRRAALLFLAGLLGPAAASAHPREHMHGMPAADSTTEHHHMMSHMMSAMHEHGMVDHDMGQHMTMTGMYGPYSMTREASGTSWQPDAASHSGRHAMSGPWALMVHGYADVVGDHQGGPRGDGKVFGSNMAMAMAQRPLGPGTLGLRAMGSLEPATIGTSGYPLLFQTGETADGRRPLVDRQHPHDLFMELAGAYSVASGSRSLFVYAGLPGEPALGPPAYMHRFSGASVPVAPIAHHWLDSSHITYGVLTLGAVADRVKLEASAFRGREPDQHRWDVESPKLDSHAFRVSVNPTSRWALQASYGRLKSPEQLEPDVDQDRTTVSAMVDGAWRSARWEGTLAWGRDRNRPGRTLDAFLVEATAEVAQRHTLFARAERVAKDELFLAPDARAGRAFHVGELTAGYRLTIAHAEHTVVALGAAGSLAAIPSELRDAYGSAPASALVFLHAALR